MAVLLNLTSNLRLRLELVRRLSDGQRTPASLEIRFGFDRYAQKQFVPMLEVPAAPLFDMDLIGFLQQLEQLLDKQVEQAAFEASGEATLGVRLIRAGPEVVQVEAGVDLLNVLETVGGLRGEPGADLMLLRFHASQRAALGFCAALLDEFAKYPTDPSKVHPGEPG